MAVKLVPLMNVDCLTTQFLDHTHLLTSVEKDDLFVPLLHCGNSNSTDLQTIVLKRMKRNGSQYVRVEPRISITKSSLLNVVCLELDI